MISFYKVVQNGINGLLINKNKRRANEWDKCVKMIPTYR